MLGPELWGVESERDMYYATKRTNGSTRVVGLAAVVLINGLVFWMMASGFGAAMIQEFTETEVAIIEVPEIEEEEPPPPPPVDVDLPPPPPQVILPDFIFDQPPPENAIRQVEAAKEPVRAAVAPVPPRPKVSTPPTRRKNGTIPEYPAASLRAKEFGDTTLSLCVDETGKVSKADIVKSSGFARLDEAAAKWALRERFNPAVVDGQKAAMCPYNLTYAWQLPKD
jgi:protein TonB